MCVQMEKSKYHTLPCLVSVRDSVKALQLRHEPDGTRNSLAPQIRVKPKLVAGFRVLIPVWTAMTLCFRGAERESTRVGTKHRNILKVIIGRPHKIRVQEKMLCTCTLFRASALVSFLFIFQQTHNFAQLLLASKWRHCSHAIIAIMPDFTSRVELFNEVVASELSSLMLAQNDQTSGAGNEKRHPIYTDVKRSNNFAH